MSAEHKELHVKGKRVKGTSTLIENSTVIVTGKWLRVASVMDEEFLDGETVRDPETFVSRLRDSDLGADIFTFAQQVPDTTPRHKYHLEWDNAAVIPITTFSDWLENRTEYDVKKALKRAKKAGVIVRLSEFDDAFVEGIRGIYNENPLRRGTQFTHYQKDFETVKRENSTYFDRSAYIGAYYENELIGFIRMLYVGRIATTLQVISQKKHADKKPTNALIAKAVEVCESKGLSHLVYGSYLYNNQSSSLTEFKRRNGFEPLLIPRYYVPTTLKGRIALKANLHHRVTSWIPQPLMTQLRKIRSRWYSRKLQAVSEAV